MNETLRVFLHVTLLSLVVSRERERERDLREVSLTTRSNARARQKRAGGDVSETTNDGFVCLFFCCKGRRGVCVRRGQREVVVFFFVTKDDDVFLERHKNTRDDFPP